MRAMGKKKAEKGEQWRWSGGGETLDFKQSMNESLTEKLAFVKWLERGDGVSWEDKGGRVLWEKGVCLCVWGRSQRLGWPKHSVHGVGVVD